MVRRTTIVGLLLILVAVVGCGRHDDSLDELWNLDDEAVGAIGAVLIMAVALVCLIVYVVTFGLVRALLGPAAWGKDDWEGFLPDLSGEWGRVVAWWLAWGLAPVLLYRGRVAEWHWAVTLLSMFVGPAVVVSYCFLVPPHKFRWPFR